MHHEYIDKLSQRESVIHRLDPRIKIIVTLAYLLMVISIPRHELFSLVPFILVPAILQVLAEIPVRYILKHTLYVSPFIASLAVFAPLFDREPVYEWMGLTVTGGWLTCGNLILKFILTVFMTILLVSTTRFNRLLKGLEKFCVPRVLIIQMSFLYRYLFLLIEEAHRLKIARDSRNFAKAAFRQRLKAVGGILSLLFLRTLSRAETVYAAMVARGFDGTIRISGPLHFHRRDWLFGTGMIFIILMIRYYLPSLDYHECNSNYGSELSV